MAVIVVSFAAFLVLFTAIGIVSATRKKSTTEDYLVAGRSVSPWLTALSAVATNNSGFMFIGLIGYTYTKGIESIWMMIGWLMGDLAAWIWVHPRVRKQSEEVNVATIPALAGTYRVAGTSKTQVLRPVIIAAGILTFVLLSVYAAAQLKAGSAALQTLFGWDPRAGAIIGAVIVVLYCFSGGIRASIWTDAAQSMVMMAALLILVSVAAWQVGGPVALSANLGAQDAKLIGLFPENLAFGFGLYLLGFVFGGFGAIGAPHILVRYMAIRSVKEIYRARNIYYLWFVPFFMVAIATGLYARALIPDISGLPVAEGMAADAASELAMPVLARLLLPDVLIGLTLAGLFSATMSTADSQILSCSGALTQDICPQWRNSYLASKMATLAVTGLALAIALFAGQGVFMLVLLAWSAMGASLGPVLLLRLLGRPPSSATALTMMTVGIVTVVFWIAMGYSAHVFELLPGMLAAFATYFASLALAKLWERAAAPAAPAPAVELEGEQ